MALVAPLLLTHPAAAVIDATNVATLALRWDLPEIGSVTGGPIFRDGRLYVGTWGSTVLAIDPTTGAEIWSRAVLGPVSGRVLVTDDGRVCFGTLGAQVGCLDAATGAVQWSRLLGEPLSTSEVVDAVWSAPIASNGRLFVGIASQTDDPCTRGRLMALDLATGNELWRLYTVPAKVCDTDTAIACTTDGDCPASGACVQGRGAGVTATPLPDPTGQWLYMNTVGCYTFPSIGDSDSMFKVNAATGAVVWKARVNLPEQFGACAADTGIDCGVDGDCSMVGGVCSMKAIYHDFGFLNGPLRLELPGPAVRIVSASKNGTLYSFDEATGTDVLKNAVRVTPVTPGFAGFGLFNGALEHADGRIYAALNVLAPARVCSNDARVNCDEDADCPGGTCPPERKHLMAFDQATLATVWEEEIGRSWSAVTYANGIVYAGTNATDGDGDASWLYAHDAATGARLATFSIPKASTARVAVVESSLYVGYGVLSGGGLRAYSLCGNGTLDAGESCDAGDAGDNECCSGTCGYVAAGTTCGAPGNGCTTTACNGEGACTTTVTGGSCDDGNPCTSLDSCAASACVGSHVTTTDLGCALAKLEASPCEGEALPAGLTKSIARTIDGIEKLAAKAAKLAAAGKAAKVARIRALIAKRVDGIAKKAAKASRSKKPSRQISVQCSMGLATLVAEWKVILGSFVF